jgi:hypothetical protein
MKRYDDIGILIPEIFLPRPGVDMTQWAVVACDQYTSEPEYWQQVEKFTGGKPSTLQLIFPEAYLDQPGDTDRIRTVQENMRSYLKDGVLEPFEGMIYVERQAGPRTRRGLMVCLDLERYDYTEGSSSLVRATEGTIVDRLPPRMRIREDAALELPHILVLIDDPQRTVIEPLSKRKDKLTLRYDFELMMNSGQLTGYLVDDPLMEAGIINALRCLADPHVFAQKYGVDASEPVLLFAMGDGNHSLATAKAVWEKIKQAADDPDQIMQDPRRYALVEIENVHDHGLDFEPIHRVMFGLKVDIFAALCDYYGSSIQIVPVRSSVEMEKLVGGVRAGRQAFGMTVDQKFFAVEISNPSSNLAVGTLQPFLDTLMIQKLAEKIDYVHGDNTVTKLTAAPQTAGFFLPCMEKSDLFRTVILDGALPRKTFSMGEAWEKRFYLECRKLS